MKKVSVFWNTVYIQTANKLLTNFWKNIHTIHNKSYIDLLYRYTGKSETC